MKSRVALESILLLLAAATTHYGCHKSGGGGHASPDAMVTMPAATATSETRAEAEYWEHTKLVFYVPVGRAPSVGPEGALVTIVEFSEFSCASCGAAAATLETLRGKYGGTIRLVWKNKPQAFRVASEPAAEAALEVRAEKGDPAFWDLHNRLFENKSELVSGRRPDLDAILKIAGAVGAKPDRIRGAIARQTHKEQIEEDLDLAEDLEVEVTPCVFVNGRRLEGAPPQERLERMIEEEIPKARDLITHGTPPSDLYETLVKNGPGPWQPEAKALPPSLPTTDPVLGRSSATATVHVWSDYQCAVCSAVERMMVALQKDYGDRVAFVWHDLPLPRHKDAQRMAQAGREAYEQKGSRGFWAMHEKIFNHSQVPTRSDLDTFAGELKLDINQWTAAMGGNAHAAEIGADVKAAAEDGIAETPAFLVTAGKSTRGYFVSATEYSSKLRRAVERALGESRSKRQQESADLGTNLDR